MIRALKDQKGNITIELLLVLAAAVIAGSCGITADNQKLHEGMSNNIRVYRFRILIQCGLSSRVAFFVKKQQEYSHLL